MWKILIQEFVGDLRAQKTRVLLTTFAVAWGTIAVVLLVAFGEGLKQTMVEATRNSGDQILLVHGGRTAMAYEGLARGRPIRLTERDMTIIERAVPGIGAISPSYIRTGVPVRTEEERTSAVVEGVHPAHGPMRRLVPASGRFINPTDVASKRRVAFIGDELAKRLYGAADPVGRPVSIDGQSFTVVGVLEHKLQNSYNYGPDSERVVIPASTFQAVFGRRNVTALSVRPRDPSQGEAVKADIYRVLGSRHRFDPEDQRALWVWDFIEDQRMTRRILLGIQLFLGLVGAFTLLVAGVGVANIMYVVAKERTREIGVKLALGARKSHITAQFVFEAVLLALGGGLAGLAVSAAVVLGVDAIPGKEGALEFLANPKLSWPIGTGTVAVLALIGLVAGVFPARRAAAVDPVESLRYE